MAGDGLWENRLGAKEPSGNAFQLCHDVHQLRPDPFNPKRYSQHTRSMCTCFMHA